MEEVEREEAPKEVLRWRKLERREVEEEVEKQRGTPQELATGRGVQRKEDAELGVDVHCME